MCNYAKKANREGTTGIDTSMLTSDTDLAGLKTKVGHLDVCKLKTVSARLSKLSNVVDDDVITKDVYDKLVAGS